MLHHPSKYHSNPLSHFLALHSSTAASIGPGSSDSSDRNVKLDMDHCDNTTTSLDEISGNIGKSFTIAAILGLKKNAAAAVAAMENHHHHHHHHLHHNNNKDFAVMNLSLNNHSVKSSLSLNNDGYGGGSGGTGNNGGGGNIIGSNNSSTENRLLSTSNNRLPLGIGQHFSSHHHHHHHQTHNSNHHGTASALQSLQQLQQQHNQNAISFHGRERSKNENSSKKSSLKSKRVRTIFTPEQLERLESEFERQQYMVGPERLYLAHTLQLTEAQVKVWFQNRRIKWRKHHLELTQQRLAIIRQRQVPSGPVGNMDQPISQQHDISGELSVCTDSMDTGSILEGDL